MIESIIPLKTELIPARFMKAEYQDCSAEFQQYFEKMKESRKGLYIWGAVGTGKTHLIFSLAQSSHESLKNLPIIILNTTDLLRRIKDQFGKEITYRDNLYAQLLDFKGLLFLDDLGSEKITDWVLETFYLLINERYEQMRPIVFTSNFNIEQLASRIGDRIVSRIVEMCEIVELKGVDRRIKIITYENKKAKI